MTEAPEPLVRDLVQWVASKDPCQYRDAIDAWKTSCPKLTVWEDALDRGLLQRRLHPDHGPTVIVTQAGKRLVGLE